MNCPVCESEAKCVDVPKREVYSCPGCASIWELAAGKTFLLKSAAEIPLSKADAKAAVSDTHVESMKSFVHVYEDFTFKVRFETDLMLRELRDIVAQAESRITGALSQLTELGLGLEGMEDVIAALEDARNLITPHQGKYGVRPTSGHAEG